ncbi:hypothetical protein L2E82_31997 [Cichorium intybus]|uniref:Uncharacterized protein n=1 Tax=Cichorium intybus TaxID=13427 RepID=A0ACB9BFH4_CICIN|nr:hypothetical protein L2E82_31997 [Cichorium intybus]
MTLSLPQSPTTSVVDFFFRNLSVPETKVSAELYLQYTTVEYVVPNPDALLLNWVNMDLPLRSWVHVLDSALSALQSSAFTFNFCSHNPDYSVINTKNEYSIDKFVGYAVNGITAKEAYEDGMLRTAYGTPNYVAPEVFTVKGYNGAPCDIWSCGVILFVLMAGYSPFDEENIIELYRRVKHSWLQNAKKAPNVPVGDVVNSRLKQFSLMNRFKRKALRVTTDFLSNEEVEDIKEMFKKIDTDDDGTVTIEELKTGLQKLNSQLAESEIQLLIEAVDTNGKGTLDYGEFVAISLHLRKMANDEHLHKAFSYFDKDGNGFIEPNELQHILKEDRDDNSADIANDIFQEVDTDKDGKISYEEFVAMMKTGTDWRKASRHYSRGRFNSLSVKLMKDGSINLGSTDVVRQMLEPDPKLRLTAKQVLGWSTTVFSAPNYCGEFDNAVGMMSVDETLMWSFQILKPVEKMNKFNSGISLFGSTTTSNLEIPQLESRSLWVEDQFGDTYQEAYFIKTLKDEVNIAKNLPSHLDSLDVKELGTLELLEKSNVPFVGTRSKECRTAFHKDNRTRSEKEKEELDRPIALSLAQGLKKPNGKLFANDPGGNQEMVMILQKSNQDDF